MARPKELSESDKFFLQNHINNDIGELSRAIKNTESVVRDYINGVKAGKINTVDFSQSIIKKERNGQIVATVMSEGASQIGDATRVNNKVNNPDIIHKCRPTK